MQRLVKLIDCSYQFHTMLKIKEMRQRIKKRKVVLNSMANFTKFSFKPFKNFGKEYFSFMLKKYEDKKKELTALNHRKKQLKQLPIKGEKVAKVSELKRNLSIIVNFLKEKIKYRVKSSNDSPGFINIVSADVKGEIVVNFFFNFRGMTLMIKSSN